MSGLVTHQVHDLSAFFVTSASRIHVCSRSTGPQAVRGQSSKNRRCSTFSRDCICRSTHVIGVMVTVGVDQDLDRHA